MALIVGAAQLVFLFNMVWSTSGTAEPAGANPWQATTLEWQTPANPAAARQLGAEAAAVVYRWAYDYSVPGAEQDFMPRTIPGEYGSPGGHA